VARRDDAGPGALLDLLESGGEPPEGELVKALRRPTCPGELVEALVVRPWLVTSHQALQLLVRHPRCPRRFAWDALPRLGWHDLLEVARDPRTSPAVRKQAERKLAERVNTITLGERTALARQAPRGVLGLLLPDADPRCIEALITNPQFTEAEALRLLHGNGNPECALVLLRHPVWGRRREVVRAAVRSQKVPLGVALGLLAFLPEAEIEALAASPDLRGELRSAAERLLQRRRTTQAEGGPAPS
jgi:hypothetical protein